MLTRVYETGVIPIFNSFLYYNIIIVKLNLKTEKMNV